MKYNLQFFAEEDVSEEVVEPQTEDVEYEEPVEETTEVEETPEEKPVQTPEENAKYAAARREAEARERAVREEMQRLDAQVASQFGDYTNPLTGERVTSVKSYFEALQAQREAQTRQEMQNAGIDPNILNSLIENNPAILQAKEVLHRQQVQEFQNTVQSEMEQIHELDPSINTDMDLLNMENFAQFKGYVDRGYNFIDAFKLANFEKLQNKSYEAANQAAINKAKSTSHLQATNSVSDEGKEMLDIPQDELSFWKDAYPDLSMKELKAKYNKTLNI